MNALETIVIVMLDYAEQIYDELQLWINLPRWMLIAVIIFAAVCIAIVACY